MSWAVVLASLVVAKQAKSQNNLWIAWVFVFVAVVFNPIAPIFLAQSAWRIADIVVIVLFVLSFFLIKPKVE